MTQRYDTVNHAWPDGTNDGCDLKPTPQEAMSAARRLYRFVRKRPFRGKIKLTSGRRYTSIRRGVMYVNPDCRGAGWHELVHDLSHYFFRQLYPGHKPHDGRHAFLERSMIEYVVAHGWLDGKLRRPVREKTKVDPKQLRHQRVLQRIDAWQSKLRRAQRALQKLQRQRRYYERLAA